jgi:archaemetzincin
VLRDEVAKLRPGRMVGGDEGAPRPPRPAGFVFVTDVDLFTANSDGVFSALLPAKGCAVVSVRRLREAFYRRKADPARQRSRLMKEAMRMSARLRGVGTCNDPRCALAESRTIPDLDLKEEKFCRVCEQRLFEGRVQA